jgi:flagellar hook-basal body complex protein FliE
MSPLSAIRHTLPLLSPLGAAGVAGASPAAGSIPLTELNTLSADTATGAMPLSEVGTKPPGCASSPAGGIQAGQSFSSVLGRLVNEVNAKQTAASDAVRDLQSGQNMPLHQAVIAMEEASVSFQLMVEVRNKLLDSYQELMRMQI